MYFNLRPQAEGQRVFNLSIKTAVSGLQACSGSGEYRGFGVKPFDGRTEVSRSATGIGFPMFSAWLDLVTQLQACDVQLFFSESFW